MKKILCLNVNDFENIEFRVSPKMYVNFRCPLPLYSSLDNNWFNYIETNNRLINPLHWFHFYDSHCFKNKSGDFYISGTYWSLVNTLSTKNQREFYYNKSYRIVQDHLKENLLKQAEENKDSPFLNTIYEHYLPESYEEKKFCRLYERMCFNSSFKNQQLSIHLLILLKIILENLFE